MKYNNISTDCRYSQIAIIAQGELGHSQDGLSVLDNDFVDWGWITDSSDKIIWEMRPEGSLHAANIFSAAAIVLSISSSVCAEETNPASNADGAK